MIDRENCLSSRGVKSVVVGNVLVIMPTDPIASDDEVLDWVNSHGRPKSSAEIAEFSNSFEKIRPYDDPKLRQLFEETYRPLGLDPKTSTIADYLDTDDRVSFKK